MRERWRNRHGTRRGRVGEQPGVLAAGFNAEALGGARLGGWRLLDRRAETRTQALRLHILSSFSFHPALCNVCPWAWALGMWSRGSRGNSAVFGVGQLELERMSPFFASPCPHGVVPCPAFPLNMSYSCLNSEISFTPSLALLTCVAFGVIREKILCPFTITGFWNIKMSRCIGTVILIGILTFD